MTHFLERSTRRPSSVPMHLVMAFAIFSTRKQEEITRIKWADLDQDGKRMLVRDMKNPGEKIGNDVWCDLPDPALAIIEAMPRNSDRIFPYSTDAISAWRQSEQLLKWLSKVSEEALDPATLEEAKNMEVSALAGCFHKYQELLVENNCLDFSDIQYEALKLLEAHPEVLVSLRAKLSHFMVHEYQDTNTIQERILLLLAGEQRNTAL